MAAVLNMLLEQTAIDDVADIQTVKPIAAKQKLAVNYLRYQ